MSEAFRASHPSVEHLRDAARRRMPGFAFDYLSGGCHSEINLRENTDAIRQLKLKPYYLRAYNGAHLETEVFGQRYNAPFGVSPIGLQGLMWPRATEYLAQAAHEANIPFILSTVATADIETVARLTDGQAWFQLYHPTEDSLRNKLLERLKAVGLPVLVALADTPSFGYRPKEIKNGLSIPPQMTVRNVLQMIGHPTWSFGQLSAGVPTFATMRPYLPKGLSLKHLGLFMNRTFSGRLTEPKLKALRDLWPGKLVVKGIVNEHDAERAIALGVDGFIVSNHGGRQHDTGEPAVQSLRRLAAKFGDKTTIMMDSGIRSGPDIACCLAAGARFVFLGRTFMYGVGALGQPGAAHTMAMLARQLRQVMEQIACEHPDQLPGHLLGVPPSAERCA